MRRCRERPDETVCGFDVAMDDVVCVQSSQPLKRDMREERREKVETKRDTYYDRHRRGKRDTKKERKR